MGIVRLSHLADGDLDSIRDFFLPEQSRGYVRRIEFCYAPKHGSWLNIAENELSLMTRQCLSGRRIGEIEELRAEINAWSVHVTDAQRGVDWQMKRYCQ